MASSEVYEVVLSGGAPWGFRLQGGREFRAPLRIAKVTPNSKAEMAGIAEGLLVKSINNADCEDWTHSDALNSIKKTGSMLKMILCRRPVSTPDFVSSDGSFFTQSSSYTTDDLRNGSASSHVSKATFKPSSSNDTLSYVTMPRGQEKRDVDANRWRNIEENNNNAFNSRKDDLSNSNEWNPDIISGVVRPPEQIKLVHGMEALRSVSSSSSTSEPTSQVRAPADTRGFVDKPRPIGRGGRRFDDTSFQTPGTNLQLTSGSIGSEEDFNMANGDASSSDSAPSTTNRPALQQFKKQKEQAAIEASKEPKPIRTVLPPNQNKPRKYSEEPRTSEPNPPGPHRPSIQRGGKWYKEMFKELHSSAGTSSNLSGLLASDVAKGTVRHHESTGSISPRSASPSPDHRGDNEVFSNRTDYVNDVPVKNTGSLSSEPRASWSSSDDDRKLPSWQKQPTSEKRPSRVSASHVPAWYKDMQRGVEVPVQKIEEPESYIVQKRPSHVNVGEERRFQEPQVSIAPMAMTSSPSSTYIDNRRAPVGMTVQMEEKYQPPSASSLYESRFRGRQQGAARKASEELQVRQQPPSDEDVFRRREEEAARRRREEEEEEQRRREEEERRRREAEEEMMRRKREEEEERLRREYEAELARRQREEEERVRREASKPQFIARALYTFNGQTAKELSFRKGDIISVRRQVDKNWIDGELNGRRGIFPTNYVEVRPVEEDDEPTHVAPSQKIVPRVQVVQHEVPPQQRQPAASSYTPQPPQAQQVSARPATQTVNVEGEAKVKYNFKAETHRELPCSKGDIISLVRKVDSNWYEGRVGDRKGIVPSSYLEVYTEPEVQVIRQEQIQSVPSARVEQAPDYGRTELGYDQRQHLQSRGPSGNMYSGQASKQTQVKYIEEREEPRFGSRGVVAHAVIDEPPRIGHEQGERYRAMFSYEPVNEDELRLEEGDEVIVLEKCDDGWFVGTSARTNLFGTFPGNYVEKVK
ncbi:Sorbin and SH3 domain-containing protein 1 [Porites harrisoni]